MKILNGLILAGGLLLPSALSALPFGLTQDEIDRGSMAIDSDRPITAKAIRKGEDGAVRLYEVKLQGESRTIITDYLVLRPAGEVETGPGRLEALAEGKGSLSFGAMSASSAALLERQLDAETCDVISAESDMSPAGTISYSDLVMRTDIGNRVMDREDTRIGKADLTLLENALQDGCLFPETIRVRNVQIRSADGASAEIGAGDVSIGLFGPAGSDLVIEATMTDLVAKQPDGAEIGAAERIRMRGSASPDMFGELTKVAELRGKPEFMKKLAAVLRKEHFGLRHEVAGARVNLGVLLGDDQARRLGADPAEQLLIESDLMTTLDRGTLEVTARNDMSGLMRGEFSARFDISPPDNSLAMAGIAGAVPGVEILGVMRLAALKLDVTDMGIQSKFRAATGQEPADAAKEKLTRVRHLPEDIRQPVEAWIEQSAKDGRGVVVMSPIEPVGLVELGMAAVMNPKGLGRMLEIRTEPED